jgi:hypothetical protein
MGIDIAFLLPHTVTVEPYLGQTGSGPAYGTGVPVRCLITEIRKLVRNADGKEVVSERGFLCGPGEPVHPDDRATIRGRPTIVLAVGVVETAGAMPTPDNMEVSCA